MTPEETAILTRCAEITAEIKATEPPVWKTWLRGDWEQETEHGPRYLISRWFGPVHERDRMRYRRAVDALEAAGLIATHRQWGLRLTNVKLTPEGAALVRQIRRAERQTQPQETK